eukprot:scaffold447969_cov27-Prasinocladus_malaysianus.AAC.1
MHTYGLVAGVWIGRASLSSTYDRGHSIVDCLIRGAEDFQKVRHFWRRHFACSCCKHRPIGGSCSNRTVANDKHFSK